MFHSARVALTVWYLLIIMVVSLSFSAAMYGFLTHEVDRYATMQKIRIERRFVGQNPLTGQLSFKAVPVPFPLMDVELVRETKDRIAYVLIAVNGAIFVMSGIIGYFLAGKTLKPIQRMMDEQTRFIGDASHELRTPLTSLKTAMEVALRDKNLSLAEARTLLTDSVHQVNRLQVLSDELLRIMRYQRPHAIERKTNNLKEILTEAVTKVSPLAQDKNITITQISPDISLMCDAHALGELFVILVDNAIKYSPPHKAIIITATKAGKNAQIIVADQGKGIDEEHLAHIFDRFYRADQSRTSADNAEGYGLGLAIAREIVTNHHGAITVKSKVGEGTTFTVRLPLKG